MNFHVHHGALGEHAQQLKIYNYRARQNHYITSCRAGADVSDSGVSDAGMNAEGAASGGDAGAGTGAPQTRKRRQRGSLNHNKRTKR